MWTVCGFGFQRQPLGKPEHRSCDTKCPPGIHPAPQGQGLGQGRCAARRVGKGRAGSFGGGAWPVPPLPCAPRSRWLALDTIQISCWVARPGHGTRMPPHDVARRTSQQARAASQARRQARRGATVQGGPMMWSILACSAGPWGPPCVSRNRWAVQR